MLHGIMLVQFLYSAFQQSVRVSYFLHLQIKQSFSIKEQEKLRAKTIFFHCTSVSSAPFSLDQAKWCVVCPCLLHPTSKSSILGSPISLSPYQDTEFDALLSWVPPSQKEAWNISTAALFLWVKGQSLLLSVSSHHFQNASLWDPLTQYLFFK